MARPARSTAAAAMIAASAFFSLFSCAAPAKVSVVHVNSLRGQIWPAKQGELLRGGFSLLSSAVKDLGSSSDGRQIAVGVYNSLHGSAEAFFTEGRAVIDLMNAVGFDALVLGPRDFYFGQEALARLAKEANFPFLAANLRGPDGAIPGFAKAYYYDSKSRTGLVGLAPRQLLAQNLDKDVRGLALADDVAAAKAAVAELKKLGAKRIGLFAGGVAWGAPEGSPAEAEALALLAVDGVDQFYFGSPSPDLPDGVFISGGRTVLRQSGARFTNGYLVARTKFAPSPEGVAFEAAAVDSSRYQPDPTIAALLSSVEEAIAAAMGDVVAVASEDLNLDFDGECAMGNLVADVFRSYTGAEIFTLNSGKIRRALSAGPITRKDVYDALPFGGNLVLTAMNGRQLLSLLNKGCEFAGKPQLGRGFLQVSGLRFSWDPNGPDMAKVRPEGVFVDGSPLGLERVYSVATEAYIFGGGDGYDIFAAEALPRLRFFDESILTILEEALRSMEIVPRPAGGRIVRL